jgi:hypothetical protein
MRRALGKGKQLINVSSLFAEVSKQLPSDEVISGVSEEGPIHPTDTHPPLNQRLKNLNLTFEEVRHDSADLCPSKPAISIVDNLEELEQELTDAEHAMMARAGEAQPASSDANSN